MSEIKLNMRYPESRIEDVTDAYMHGFEFGLAMRADENAKLRDAARLMWQRLRWADETMGCGVIDKRFERRMRELGIEVDA